MIVLVTVVVRRSAHSDGDYWNSWGNTAQQRLSASNPAWQVHIHAILLSVLCFFFNSYAIAADTMDDKYIKGETLGVGTFASVVKATVKEVS